MSKFIKPNEIFLQHRMQIRLDTVQLDKLKIIVDTNATGYWTCDLAGEAPFVHSQYNPVMIVVGQKPEYYFAFSNPSDLGIIKDFKLSVGD